jgi:RNA polymerase sigma-70 factor (ECF subfamily)
MSTVYNDASLEEISLRIISKKTLKENVSFDEHFERVKHDDSCKSFKIIYRHYYNPLLFFARKFLSNLNEAEEVLSEVFLKLWNKRKDITINSSFQSFLYASVRNKCLDFIRKNSNRKFESQESASHLISDTTSPDDLMDSADLFYRIEAEIESLPEKRKEIFKMSRNEGLKYNEIAERLGVSIKTVETQMGRSLKHLRTKFADELADYFTY